MNHDELIKSMKDKGITVKVDNGNKLEFSNGETYVKDSHSGEYKKTKNIMENKMNIRKFVESKLFEGEYKGAGNFELNWKLMDYETASQADIFGADWSEEIDSSKPVYEDRVDDQEFWCYTNVDGDIIVNRHDEFGDDESITYDSYKDAGVEINEADLAQWQRYIRLANGKDESTVKEGRKPIYPVTLEQYIDVLKGQYEKRGWDYDLPENIAKGKYDKACYVYSDIKKNGNWDYRFNRAKWYDSEFGNLKKPEDAFQIDWDM